MPDDSVRARLDRGARAHGALRPAARAAWCVAACWRRNVSYWGAAHRAVALRARPRIVLVGAVAGRRVGERDDARRLLARSLNGMASDGDAKPGRVRGSRAPGVAAMRRAIAATPRLALWHNACCAFRARD
ncbi:hypothetical protein [Solimonas variicoloris]|uniref:hypothetical protein n=1 Tax=Solimonas variicoloris TaxID=254408 RepID=UPI0012B5D7F3|nr:hypothetical protein [Solimonas variicoloris]